MPERKRVMDLSARLAGPKPGEEPAAPAEPVQGVVVQELVDQGLVTSTPAVAQDATPAAAAAEEPPRPALPRRANQSTMNPLLNVRVPIELRQQLKRFAEDNDSYMQDVVILACQEFLARYSAPATPVSLP